MAGFTDAYLLVSMDVQDEAFFPRISGKGGKGGSAHSAQAGFPSPGRQNRERIVGRASTRT